METPPSPDQRETKKKSSMSGCQVLGFFGIFGFLFLITIGPITDRPHSHQNGNIQAAHAMGLAMYSYANDNNGNYPDGKSSTEVFQQLVDGGYVTDPSIFYVPCPGKVKAVEGQKLKPENICWDVTGGVTTNSPGEVPILFLTGYRINYSPGGSAIPIPTSDLSSRTWSQWWNRQPPTSPLVEGGAAVYYLNKSAAWDMRTTGPDGTSSIPHIIPPSYQPDGKTYRQLTPEGELKPPGQ